LERAAMAQTSQVLDEAQPTAGCKVCSALAQQREEARELRDMSAVSDCNVEIRRHPHGTKR
jgi:hypothetical protein